MTVPNRDPLLDLAALDAAIQSLDEILRHPAFTEHVGMRVLFQIEHDESVEPIERSLAGQDYARHRTQMLGAFRRLARVTGKYDGLADFLAMLAEHGRLP